MQNLQRSRPLPIAMGVSVLQQSTGSMPSHHSAHLLSARYELKKTNSDGNLIIKKSEDRKEAANKDQEPDLKNGQLTDPAMISSFLDNAHETDIL